MPSPPGGLAHINKLLGFNLYMTAFYVPVVFGTFPSLDSGYATI